MYNNPLFSREKERLFSQSSGDSRTPSMSTVATPVSEEELAAARMVLRSVIPSTRQSPNPSSANCGSLTVASVPPVPLFESKQTQTDSRQDKVPLEGLVRAAGLSLANFAEELKNLERRIDSNQSEILNAMKDIRSVR